MASRENDEFDTGSLTEEDVYSLVKSVFSEDRSVSDAIADVVKAREPAPVPKAERADRLPMPTDVKEGMPTVRVTTTTYTDIDGKVRVRSEAYELDANGNRINEMVREESINGESRVVGEEAKPGDKDKKYAGDWFWKR